MFTEACLQGLRARLYDDIASLDDYLPPQVAEMARKVTLIGLEVGTPGHVALPSQMSQQKRTSGY